MTNEEISQELAWRFINSFLWNGRITKEQMFRAFEIVKERLTPQPEEEKSGCNNGKEERNN